MMGRAPNNIYILQGWMSFPQGQKEKERQTKQGGRGLKYTTGERNSSAVLVMYDKSDII